MFLIFQCFFNKISTKRDTSLNALRGIVLSHSYGKNSVSGKKFVVRESLACLKMRNLMMMSCLPHPCRRRRCDRMAQVSDTNRKRICSRECDDAFNTGCNF